MKFYFKDLPPELRHIVEATGVVPPSQRLADENRRPEPAAIPLAVGPPPLAKTADGPEGP